MSNTIKEALVYLHHSHRDDIDGTDGCRASIDQALAEIKRIIEEAKPEKRQTTVSTDSYVRAFRDGFNDSADYYHNNLLKALEG